MTLAALILATLDAAAIAYLFWRLRAVNRRLDLFADALAVLTGPGGDGGAA
jgi:hypothetical protein